MSLDVSRKTSLSLFRPAQQDLTLSLADNLIRPELPDQLSAFLEKLTAKPMIRRFDFGSVKGKFFWGGCHFIANCVQISMRSKPP
jgi:hypothetical protein